MQIFLNMLLNAAVLAFSLQAVSVGQEVDALNQVMQYGHNAGWSTRLDLLSRDFKLRETWQISIGEGRGQAVGDESTIYVRSGASKKNENGTTEITTTITAIDAGSGKINWEYNFDAATMSEPDRIAELEHLDLVDSASARNWNLYFG